LAVLQIAAARLGWVLVLWRPGRSSRTLDGVGRINEETRLERLINRMARSLPAPLAALVTTPMGAAGLLLMLGAWLIPRRLPDLRRFTISDQFVALHVESVDWTRALFALIEERAPWLQPTGRRTDDSCCLEVTPEFDVELPAIGVQCDRRVVGVYGVDGPIRDRLAGLGAILAAAGCEKFFLGVGSGYGPLESGPSRANARWRDPRRAGAGDEDNTPPAGITQYRTVGVGWASRGEPPNPDYTLDGRWRGGGPAEPDPPPNANSFEHAVEMAYANIGELAARALASHEHVIAIALQHCYYVNPDIRQHPLPRRLIPRLVWFPFRQ
jgi:hypothetical protein